MKKTKVIHTPVGMRYKSGMQRDSGPRRVLFPHTGPAKDLPVRRIGGRQRSLDSGRDGADNEIPLTGELTTDKARGLLTVDLSA